MPGWASSKVASCLSSVRSWRDNLVLLPQMSAKKKGAKDVEVVTALRAFEATYKAACREHGTLPYKPLLKTLQQAQDESRKCDKILLIGPSVDGAVASAVAECLASYAAVNSLCCYGCSIGDEGLIAIAHLLRASASKWWKGCRLATLEVIADGRVLPLQPTPAAAAMPVPQKQISTAGGTFTAAPDTTSQAGAPASAVSNQLAAGDAATAAEANQKQAAGAGAYPSSGLPAGAMQTPGTSSRPRSAAGARSALFAPGALAGLLQQQTQQQWLQRPSTAPSRSCGSPNSLGSQQKQLPPGVCPPVPAHLQLNFPTHVQLAQQSLSERCGPGEQVRYKAQPPRPMIEVGRWVLDATLEGWKQHQQELFGSSPAGSCSPKSPGFASPSSWSAAVVQANSPTQCQAAGQGLVQQGSGQQPQLGQQQAPEAARLEAEICPRFGSSALQELSLGLGVAGLSISRLVLDHTLIGDAGISVLSAGLSKCRSLKHLSICYCGVGPAGIKDLAAACAPASSNAALALAPAGASNPATVTAGSRLSTVTGSNIGGLVEGVSSSSSSSSGIGNLNLEVLLLNGNPLGAAGLQQLNPALRLMSALKVLGLADIGVTDVDKVQLQGLVYALTIGPTNLEQLDFDANYIGDRAASHFLTLLPTKPSLIVLKLTARISPDVVTQMTQLLEQNLKAAKPKGKKKAPKKK